MVYFFPGPFFLLWLLIAALVVSLVATVPSLKRHLPVAWRVAAWATVGGLVANVLSNVLAIWLLPLAHNSSPQDGLYFIDRAPPSVVEFLASAGCWLGGAAIGVVIFRCRSGALPPNTSLERTRDR
jgi:hypothetical protein